MSSLAIRFLSLAKLPSKSAVLRETQIMEDMIQELTKLKHLTNLDEFLASEKLESDIPLQDGLLRILTNSIPPLGYVQIMQGSAPTWAKVTRDDSGSYAGVEKVEKITNLTIAERGNVFKRFAERGV